MIDGLLRQVRNMNKSTFNGTVVNHIHEPVKHVVAHKGSSGLRDAAWNACLTQIFDSCFDGQCRKVCGRSVFNNRAINRLLANIVRDSSVVYVNSNAFDRNSFSAACLSNANDDGGAYFFYISMKL